MKFIFSAHARQPEKESIWPDVLAAVGLVIILLAFIAIAGVWMRASV